MQEKRNIKDFLKDYEFDNSIWNDDEEKIYYIKRALEVIKNNKTADYLIFMMYVEDGSLRKVGRRINVSHTIIYKMIKEIRNNILEIVKKLKKDDDDISKLIVD